MLRSTIDDDSAAWALFGERRALERLLHAYDALPRVTIAALCTLARAENRPVSELENPRYRLDEEQHVAFARWREAASKAQLQRDPGEIASYLHGASSASMGRRVLASAAPEPGVAPSPECARPLPGATRAFSASALNMFAQCPRRWFFRYLCDPIEEPSSPAASYGTAFHAALEAFHKEYRRPTEAQRAEMAQRLDALLIEAFDRARARFATAVEVDLQTQRARMTAKHYLTWLIARAARDPFEVIGIEQAVNLTIDGNRFVGYIDRLDRFDADNSVGVIDYKTGSIAQSAKEYREQVQRFEDFQLPFYYWSQSLAGERVSRLALLPLKDATLPVIPIELEVVSSGTSSRDNGPRGSISIDDLTRARERIVALCDDLRSGTRTSFEASKDPDACTYCTYTLACTARPAAEPERFSR